jgi:nucleoside-diphosphate-sugar epimerase
MSVDALGKFGISARASLDGKRLAVFGAGYVGSALAEAAQALGAKVTALTRNSRAAAGLEELGIAVVQAELDSSGWHAGIGKMDMAVNCVSSGGGGEAGYVKSYRDGTRSILQWAGHSGAVDTLLYTSSTSVYPQTDGTVDEGSATTPAAGTARILLEAEELVFQAAAMGLSGRSIVLRLAGIYGPGRHHLLDRLREGADTLAGTGDHLLNLVHRDDIVKAVLTALSSPVVETRSLYNVTDDHPTPKADVVRWLAERLGRPVPVFSGGAVAGRRSNPPNRAVSNRRLKEQLGWALQYPDFRRGYEQILGA